MDDVILDVVVSWAMVLIILIILAAVVFALIVKPVILVLLIIGVWLYNVMMKLPSTKP